MREDWTEVIYRDCVIKVSTTKQKLKQKEYLDSGKYAVIDQGKLLVGGYTNDKIRVLKCNLPVIVFGDHTKAIKLVNFEFAPGADGTKVLEVKKYFLPKLLFYFTKCLLPKIDKGYARHYQYLEKEILPLPPLQEQRVIVAKIEKLFSSLDNGIANLKKSQALLKIYRQAVLKKAFEGELTKEWREKQTDLPSAEELLEQIKTERERYYNQQLEDWKTKVKEWEDNGKEGKKPGKPTYHELANKMTNECLIPESWTELTSKDIFNFVTSGSRGWAKYYSESGSMFIRITNLNFDTLALDLREEKMKYVSLPSGAEGKRTIIKEGDFLFSITGYLGMFAIAPKLKDAYVNQHISLARPYTFINSSFVGYWVIAKSGGIHFLNLKRKGATKAGLGLDDIKGFPIPYCSQEEQNQIVLEIESRLSVCDKVEESIEIGLKKSEALRQSILKKAFEGALLSEVELAAYRAEADWESAKVLLERIKNEKKV